jgi:excisionase family DNA binding protein
MPRTSLDDLDPLVWTAEEAARLLQVSRPTVHDMIRRGALRGVKIGRRTLVPKIALEEFIANGGAS